MHSPHQQSLPGEDIKMVCFVNGYPTQEGLEELVKRGPLEKEVAKLTASLAHEIYSPKVFLVQLK